MEYERFLQLLTPSTGLTLLRVVCCAGAGRSLVRSRPGRSNILHSDLRTHVRVTQIVAGKPDNGDDRGFSGGHTHAHTQRDDGIDIVQKHQQQGRHSRKA